MKAGRIVDICITLLSLRRPKRALVILTCVVLVILVLRRRQTERVTSLISCKNELPQQALPRGRIEAVIEEYDGDPHRLEQAFFQLTSSMTQQCYDQMHIGPSEDGGWEVCVDRRFDIRPPCLVYSFGIGHDFRFEKGVESKLGCEVHAFDPSMGVLSHTYSDKGHFYDYGLDRSDRVDSNTGWNMKRLASIMKVLGHEGKTLDYLKMDVEYSEWLAFLDIIDSGLTKNIRQIAVEVHTPEMDIHHAADDKCTWSTVETYALFVHVLRALREEGFQLYYVRTNYRTKFESKLTGLERYCCHNLHMVNTKHERNKWRDVQKP